MDAGTEIILIAMFTAAGCALVGSFLVLRKMSMMSDSVSHTILLGIVIGFFLSGDLNSPLLIIGATIAGVFTVWLIEALSKTRLVSSDSAMGVVFPLLFSVAVILISRHTGSVHLDTDSVLLGELAFAPFDRLIANGADIGAKGLYTSGALLLIDAAFIAIFYKELKIVSFDPSLAAALGISPVVVHYALMTAVSLTTVGSFETAGSVLVVAFMTVPPSAAYLLTDRLCVMLPLAAAIGSASAFIGYMIAMELDVSIAGSMACCAGAFLLLTVLFSPKKGILSRFASKVGNKK